MKSIVKVTSCLLLCFGLANASEYKLDNSHTTVGFSVKHLMITNVKGDFKNYDAKIDFDNATKSFKTFSANIDTGSVDTGIEKRDAHLKSDDFFSVEKFNSATLVVKNAALLSAGVYTVTADMTIKGITKEVVFNALVNQSGGTATADIKLDRTDFDIRYGSGKFFPNIGDKMIHDEFNLKVNLAFGKAL